MPNSRKEEQMKVLIVGSGGREHAIAWAVAKSPRTDKIYCAPGNAGIAEFAECVDIAAMEFDKLVAFAKEKEIDLTIIGMDDPLVGGIVDAFEAEGLRVFGPRKNAAIIEGSKAFSKDLMKKYNIPTAGYENFTDPDAALAYLETAKMPIVLKADGLALGKGVLICNTLEEAKEGVKTLMLDKQFGDAGNEIVIEEFMTGREVSVLAYCDGKTIKCMTSAQDHKRAKDGDQGLNTGGMGTFSPSPFYTKEVEEFCEKYVYQPTMDAMAAEGRPFTGILFTGLMLTEDGPKVLEYNARFGDPEAQVVLPRMKNDIIDVMEACIDGKLADIELEFEDNAAVCVVLASDGYPEKYDKGFEIKGLDAFKEKDGYYVFHAGTKFDGDKIVTNGGRVLGVVAKGDDLKSARANAYAATEWIDFANKYKRNDIGKAIDEA
jgi:phosphoribosylamine--glycine ligase